MLWYVWYLTQTNTARVCMCVFHPICSTIDAENNKLETLFNETLENEVECG